jgi:porphobilinogen synthase
VYATCSGVYDSRYPDLEIYTDVALDPYNCDGHDGIVRDDGVILNDETIHYLCKQVRTHRLSLSQTHSKR